MAHRGNQVACPENTVAAFHRAVEDGADILETDLHLTADGIFVCIHDDTVDRTTDGRGEVARMTLEEIKDLSAGYGREGFESERVPTLSETASILPEDMALALELKSGQFLQPHVCRQLVSEIDRLHLRNRSLLISFSLPRLDTLHTIAPDIPTGFITMSRWWPGIDTRLLGPYWPLLVVNPLYVWLAHRRARLVCPLDDRPDSRLWLYRLLGVDAVLTNDPGATLRALGRSES
jgi:glycerophosphoryl diester phosphodiesterase